MVLTRRSADRRGNSYLEYMLCLVKTNHCSLHSEELNVINLPSSWGMVPEWGLGFDFYAWKIGHLAAVVDQPWWVGALTVGPMHSCHLCLHVLSIREPIVLVLAKHRDWNWYQLTEPFYLLGYLVSFLGWMRSGNHQRCDARIFMLGAHSHRSICSFFR